MSLSSCEQQQQQQQQQQQEQISLCSQPLVCFVILLYSPEET